MEKLGPGDPQRIGAYRLLARLGAGGMGQVYLARSGRGRTVAVKLVRRELAEQEEFRARFRQEVQAARRVGGHWTAPVLDADTEAAVPWVATGYVAGPTLQQVVGHDHGALPERSVRILAAGLAGALKDIHAAGLIHRDLKPSNVLVTIDGPRVIDFGIARALETVTDGGLTRTGALVGSPGFMAPEQVRGDRVTPACDVFCLGSVLAYAATGALPFGGADSGVHALMFRIAEEEPDLEALPEGIADLVRACLKKDPAKRPTLDHILRRSGAEDTVAGGRSRDPWLPSALVAQLGRHAVQLLDAENPEEPGEGAAPEAGGPAGRPGDAPDAAAGASRGAGAGFGVAGGTPGAAGSYGAGAPGAHGVHDAGAPGAQGAGAHGVHDAGTPGVHGAGVPGAYGAGASGAQGAGAHGVHGAGAPGAHGAGAPGAQGAAGSGVPAAAPSAPAAPGAPGQPPVAAPAVEGPGAAPVAGGQHPAPASGTPAASGTPVAGAGTPAAPYASPEHAPTADASAPAVPPPGQPGGSAHTPLNHLPTMVAGQTPPPGPAPAHPAYGYPQQHPQPAAHGHPQQPGAWSVPPGSPPPHAYGGLGSTPPYGPPPAGSTPPYGPATLPVPETPRRSGRSTAALVAVALIVALGAGGSVYALMRGGGSDDKGSGPGPSRTTNAPTTPGPATPEQSPPPTQSESPSPAGGVVPTAYLGTWTSTINNAFGANTRRLTITQGQVGDSVLTLVADGPAGGGSYHCVFSAQLTQQPGGSGALEIGPSTVTSGAPSSACTPGAATEVTLLPDGSLRRVNTSSGEQLIYTRQ
ncbi:protein kinase [Streptomyces sp. NPDC046197]|uniref:serine/threonine-protein kinase n=1 Tax=Streptomyces sp. NPDC046197 TaxID=3154337 RepID=UPI0033F64CCD